VYAASGWSRQTRALKHGADIVVATPVACSTTWSAHVNFSKLEVLVLDEADRMLDMGFAPDVRKILNALPMSGRPCSLATISPEWTRWRAGP